MSNLFNYGRTRASIQSQLAISQLVGDGTQLVDELMGSSGLKYERFQLQRAIDSAGGDTAIGRTLKQKVDAIDQIQVDLKARLEPKTGEYMKRWEGVPWLTDRERLTRASEDAMYDLRRKMEAMEFNNPQGLISSTISREAAPEAADIRFTRDALKGKTGKSGKKSKKSKK